jgi:hypothetical protein
MLNKHSRIAVERSFSRLGVEHGTNSPQHKKSSILLITTKYHIGIDFNQVRSEFNDKRIFVETLINLLFLYKQRIHWHLNNCQFLNPLNAKKRDILFKTKFTPESSIFSYIKSCSLAKGSRCFGGTYHLRLQGRKVSQARNRCKVGSKQRAYFSTLKMDTMCSFEMSVAFTGLHDLLSQKAELFIATRTWNPA